MSPSKDNKVEDVLVQLSNTHLPDKALLETLERLHGLNLTSNLRNRALKAINSHCSRDSIDVRTGALNAGVHIIRLDSTDSNTCAAGAVLNFYEKCQQILLTYIQQAEPPSQQQVVLKALEGLALANLSTLQKLFAGKTAGTDFVDIVTTCLKTSDLCPHALALLERGLSLEDNVVIGKAVHEQESKFIEVVYPLLFDSKQHVRKAALSAMKKMNFSCKPPSWKKMKTDTEKYCKQLIEMVKERELDWPALWQFTVNIFGDELHSGAQLINNMLEVLERAYKHTDLEWTRVQAFRCWNVLIDNFKSGLGNQKRIALLLIPLRASNHRTQLLTSAKLDTYELLLQAMEKNLSKSPEVLLSFMTYCFGSEKDSLKPVKAYAALQDRCVKAMKQVLEYCRDKDLFLKVFKQVIGATGECFLLKDVGSNSTTEAWQKLLELIKVYEEEDIYKDIVRHIFETINKLVTCASNPENSGVNPVSSPASSSVKYPNVDLGAVLVAPVLYSTVTGDTALKRSVFNNTAYYTGSSEVMTGTPSLLIIEWLLTPGLLLGAGESVDYRELMTRMILFGMESPVGFLRFSQSVLKKLALLDELLLSSKLQSGGGYLSVWFILSDQMLKFMNDGGEINEGDAAQHDFRCLYGVLTFPVQHLHQHIKEEKLSRRWGQVYQKASTLAALVTTADSHEFCEQVSNRLANIPRQSKHPMQLKAVYHLISTLLRTESSEGLKASKKWCWVQVFISGVLKDLAPLGVSKVFTEAAYCVRMTLKPPPSKSSVVVLQNLAVLVHELVKENMVIYEPLHELYKVLIAMKDTVVRVRQQSKENLKTLKTALADVISAGQDHLNQKLRGATKELLDALEGKVAEEQNESQVVSSPGSILHSPLSVSPRKQSPSNIFPKRPINNDSNSPSSISPRHSRRKQLLVPENDTEFIKIETPPKTMILTEHQKEIRREKRHGVNIPAMYQDLTQDTQSLSQDLSQDCITLPSTPNSSIKKLKIAIDEDAVMDVEDVDSSIQVLSSPSVIKAQSSDRNTPTKELVGLPKPSFPPSGFVLPPKSPVSSSAKDAEKAAKQKSPIGADSEKENEDKIASPSKSPHRRKSAAPTKRVPPTLTRTSVLNQKLTTRSGRVLKRHSLALGATDVPKKLKRKSLPAVVDEAVSKADTVENSSPDAVGVTADGKPSNIEPTKKRGRKKKVCEENTPEELAREKETVKDQKSTTSIKETVTAADALKKLLNGKLEKKEGLKDSKPVTSPKKIESSISDVSKAVNAKHEKTVFTRSSSFTEDVKEKLAEKEITHGKASPDLSVLQEKPLGGKTLRRSRSKSNLDDVLPVKEGETKLDVLQEETSKVASNIDNSDMNESQDIIESSQEPIVVTPCAVNLKTFKDPQPNGKIEIEDVVLMKGPDAGSPFKVLSPGEKETEKGHMATARRLLSMDCPGTPESPSSGLTLRVSDTGTPVCGGKDKSVPGKDIEDASIPKATVSIGAEVKAKVSDVGLVEIEAVNTATDGDTPSGSSRMTRQTKSYEKMDTEAVNKSPKKSETSSACSDSMPDWMHAKKVSPPNKPSRSLFKRGTNIASEAEPLPVNGSEDAHVSSPVQQKKSSSSFILKRSSRSAQLVGLGQAAAARGGDTVLPSAQRSREEREATISSSLTSTTNSANSVTSNVSLNQAANLISSNVFDKVVASPSLLRKRPRPSYKPDVESPKATPSKTIQEGNKEEWVPRTPRPEATPDNSILKRKRETDIEISSPSAKRKRVSFRDPPLSTMLAFNSENAHEQAGFVYCDATADGKNGDMGKPIIKPISYDDEEEEDEITMVPVEKERSEAKKKSEVNDRNQVQEKAEENNRKTEETDKNRKLDELLLFEEELCRIQEAKQRRKLEEEEQKKKLEQERKLEEERHQLELEKLKKKVQERELARVKETQLLEVRKAEESKTKVEEIKLKAAQALSLRKEKSNEKSSETPRLQMLESEYQEVLKATGLVKSLRSEDSRKKEQAQQMFNEYITEETKISKKAVEEEILSLEQRKLGIEMEKSSLIEEEKNEACREETHERNQLEDMCASELMEVETQGMLDELLTVPSATNLVYAKLVGCTAPIEDVAKNLTTSTWYRALLREFKEKGIRTVGDLAGLTEEKVNRLSVRHPRIDNVQCVLKEFELNYNSKQNGVSESGYSEVQRVPAVSDKLQTLLMESSVADITEELSKQGKEKQLCRSLSSSALYEELVDRLGEEGLLTDVINRDEKKALQTVVSRIGTGAVLDALRPQDVSAAISARQHILSAVSADSVAEAYISQVQKTSGKKERNMTPEQYATITRKVDPNVVQEVICPSDKRKSPALSVEELLSYVLRECKTTSILEKINKKDMLTFLKTEVDGMSDVVLDAIRRGQLSDSKVEILTRTLLSQLDKKKLLCLLFETGLDYFK